MLTYDMDRPAVVRATIRSLDLFWTPLWIQNLARARSQHRSRANPVQTRKSHMVHSRLFWEAHANLHHLWLFQFIVRYFPKCRRSILVVLCAICFTLKCISIIYIIFSVFCLVANILNTAWKKNRRPALSDLIRSSPAPLLSLHFSVQTCC